MNYDYYGYKSNLILPSLQEARAKLDSPNTFTQTTDVLRNKKFELASALKEKDPEFEILIFDYAEIARDRGISLEDTMIKLNYIEMNRKGGDLTVTFFDDLIQISTSVGFNRASAEKDFQLILTCMKSISLFTGYVFYDPQADEIIEPLKIKNLNLTYYFRAVDRLSTIPSANSYKKRKWFKWW